MKKRLLYLLVITLFSAAGFFTLKLMRHWNEQIPTIIVSRPATKLDNAISIPDIGKEIAIEVSFPGKLSESTISGTIISGYSKDNKLIFSAGLPLTWNTYYASQPGEIHLFVRTPSMDSSFTALPRTLDFVHSAYILKADGNIFLYDAPNSAYYQMKEDSENKYTVDKKPALPSPETFRNIGYSYTNGHEKSDDWISACLLSNADMCDKIAILPSSIIFAYGGNNTNTVAVTNRGEVLFHNSQGWCRGEKIKDGFKCNRDNLSPVPNKGLQLYSSIKTEDGTLLGGYPTGRFWLLGDGILQPTSFSPYSEAKARNLELQSVSLFCGDLYAGFWPLGEIWQKSPENNIWNKTKRLFSHPLEVDSGESPYSEQLKASNLNIYPNHEFLGQRVTSMANHKNSLFAASGNLGGWVNDTTSPPFLNDFQINEYGLIYVKTDSNCLTTVIDGNIAMKIIIDSNNISVYNDGAEIARTKLHDFDIKQIDHFQIGQGVFGPISDKSINVRVMGI
jgi:hypothetical protein